MNGGAADSSGENGAEWGEYILSAILGLDEGKSAAQF